MSRSGCRLDGADEFDRRLEGLSDLSDADALKALGFNALEPVADAARGLVRKDTGRLERSIGVGDQLSPAQAAANVVDSGTVEIYVGPGALVEAITEEFGTVHEQGHPFMRPAWDGKVAGVMSRLVSGVRIAFRKGAQG